MATRHNQTPKKRVWEKAFLAALRDSGNVRLACQAAKVARPTVYEYRQADPGFATAWNEALDEACDLLEAEARRRGLEGVDKPVFHQGEEVGVVRNYSDTLLIFLLKGARPWKYRDHVSHEVIGQGGGPIRIRAEELSDDQLAAIATAGGRASITPPPGS